MGARAGGVNPPDPAALLWKCKIALNEFRAILDSNTIQLNLEIGLVAITGTAVRGSTVAKAAFVAGMLLKRFAGE